MISYYELLLMISTGKKPNKILVPLEGKEVPFCWNNKYDTYYIQDGYLNESNSFEFDSYLYFNIDEEEFFNPNITVVDPCKFVEGELVSYADLLNSIKMNCQPYRVRYHINNYSNDYIYEDNNYVEMKDTYSIPTWESHLSRAVGMYDILDKDIEIISVDKY